LAKELENQGRAYSYPDHVKLEKRSSNDQEEEEGSHVVSPCRGEEADEDDWSRLG
jgi:hypothetical protein